MNEVIGATFDKSKTLPLYARIGEIGEPVTLVFQNSNGTPFDISSYNFSVPVRRKPTDLIPVFTLTIGDGLTIVGADNNKLKLEISAARSNQRNETHFWRLFSLTEVKTWLNGFFRFHNGEFDGIAAGYSTTLCDMDVTITITGGDSASLLWEDWNASTNTLPSNPKVGTFYQATASSTSLLGPDGGPILRGTVITPKVSSPGTDITDSTKWALFYGLTS